MKGLLVALIVGASCVGQSLSQTLDASSVGRGATPEQIAQAYGPPIGYFWRGRTYATPPATDESVYAVHRFKQAGNEFELRIDYWLDISESRLHPTPRVATITMIADKPVIAADGLMLMPGAQLFCRNYCGIRRLIPGRALLLTQDNDRSFDAWTIQVFMNDVDGSTIADAMKDLNSYATCFVLSQYDYSHLPLTRGVSGGWPTRLKKGKK